MKGAVMKKYLLGSAAIIGLNMVGSALAADMPVKARPLPPAPAVVYNWTGCYIGGNVGGGWSRIRQSDVGKVSPPAVLNPAFDFGSAEDSGFIGGGQIGCDYQFQGNWVVGVQGKFDFGDIDSAHALPAFPTFTSSDRVKNMFTVTGRLGYLVTPALLAYVRGGGAWARTSSFINATTPVAFLSESAVDIDRSGWTVGGGLEWMFAPGWSMFGEYNHLDFGRSNINYVRGPLAVVNAEDVVRTKLTVQQALFGINYKFNWLGPLAN
jgi:outer membrane immunogenic protein